MYFWNTQQLALDLQEGRVTERQKMWYLFVWVLGVSLVFATSELTDFLRKERDAVYIITSVAEVAVNIIGFFLCYQANSRGGNRDFVVRFICMSWPVGLRLLAAYIPALIFVAVIPAILLSGGAPGPFSAIFDRLADGAGVLFEVAYYAIIRRWLIKISSGQVGAVSNG